jgi:hypothetical protein
MRRRIQVNRWIRVFLFVILHQYFVHLVAELPDLSELSSTLLLNLDHIGRDECSVGCLQFGPQLVISDFHITPGPSGYELWQHQNHN